MACLGQSEEGAFPKVEGVSVAKVRIAAEELYKIEKAKLDEHSES